MPKIIASFRTAAAASFDTVTATAQTVSSGITSVSMMAQAAEAHAANYLRTTQTELQLSAEAFTEIATYRARLRVAHAKLDLRNELKDSELADIFNSIKFDHELPAKPAVSIAAE